MVSKRTEEQKVIQATIEVILGGKEYKIAPLVIRDSREWRKKVIKLISPLPGLINIKTDDLDGFGEALTQLLVTMSDEVLGLFFEYARDLDRDVTEAEATDAEIRDAFAEVMKVAFPLAEALPATLRQMLPKG